MDFPLLLRPRPPCLHVLVASEPDACALLTALPDTAAERPVSRLLRGHKARTRAALFDEFAAALQFPCYFGDNWDAFDECLTDLAWLPGNAYVFLIVRSIQLLDQEPADQLQLFLKTVQNAAEEWSKPAPHAPRPARAFHVLFQCVSEHEAVLSARLSAAAVAFDVLRPVDLA
ncbi:MAG TPA: barstar family protein [Gemmataceae bacterium]|jgi:hypothetical protein|nr:barstar family protein [Gemmataceae bacterium]